jgi:4a-hydroxytetrahydrobiopterin dehydratase
MSGLPSNEIEARLAALEDGWMVVDDHHLSREFRFRNFEHALEFVNRAGELAESMDHHPDLHLSYGRVRLEIWTHRLDALTAADFDFAARAEALYDPPTL